MRFFWIILVLFCSCRRLDVERRFVDQRNLASTFVGSPDPLQTHPPVGEQLWVYWNIPANLIKDDLTLTVKIIFKNLEEDRVAYLVTRRHGRYVYSLLDQDYKKKGGILAYEAEVTDGGGAVIKLVTSQMWFRPIKLF
jgi:hypothetical protein